MKEQHVLFGVSPFNSRFSDMYIERMLNWGFDNYDKVDVIHPHEESRYLLIGCGDNENKARKKARKEFNRAERTIYDYLSKNGRLLSSGKILRFSDFYNNIAYQYFLEKVRKDYTEDRNFYDLCVKQSEKAIIKRKISTANNNIINKKDIEIATEYIIRELPFLIAPSVLLATDSNIHISYYCTWPVAEYLYHNNLSLSPHSYTKIVIKDHAA